MRSRYHRAATCLFGLLGTVFGASAQTMVEYGHLGAGAATGAAGLRKASPASTFGRVGSSLRRGAETAPWHPMTASATSPGGAPNAAAAPLNQPLTVLRAQWGPASDPPASEAAVSNSEPPRHDSSRDEPKAAFDPSAAGLQPGMDLAQVVHILGDPVLRTSGLAGRGYDEKAMFRLDSGWQVVVYAARGRARDFSATPIVKKSSSSLLPASGSVIP
jgi:hypothetical protein